MIIIMNARQTVVIIGKLALESYREDGEDIATYAVSVCELLSDGSLASVRSTRDVRGLRRAKAAAEKLSAKNDSCEIRRT